MALLLRVLAALLATAGGRGDHIAFPGQQGVPNHNPLFRHGPDILVVEGSGLYGPNQWCSDPVDGDGPLDAMNRPTHSGQQSLRFAVTPGDPTLFAPGGLPRIDDTCLLTFTPAQGTCGVTTVSVVLEDDGNPNCVSGTLSTGVTFLCPGGCSPSDCSKSSVANFDITIMCCNDPPTFEHLGDQTVLEDAGRVEVKGWARNIEKGAVGPGGTTSPFELQQMLTFTVTVTSSSVSFSTPPYITWDPALPRVANLVFEVSPGQCGEATVQVELIDDGGTQNGCPEKQIDPQTARIYVVCDNDPPSFIAGPTDIRVLEDQGMWCHKGWARAITASEPGQDLFFELVFLDASHRVLFSTLPHIDPVTGDLCFETAPDANTFGRDVRLYVRLTDSGGMAPRDRSCDPIDTCPVVTITVLPVNDPPTASCGPDIDICEDMAHLPTTPDIPRYAGGTNFLSDLGVGAVNEGVCPGCEGQRLTFTVVADNPSLFAAGPSIDEQGTLTFDLLPNAHGVTYVQVTVRDTGDGTPPGSNTGPTCTFAITVREVNDPATFRLPFPPPLVVSEDALPSETDWPSFAVEVSRGAADEDRTQTARFVVVASNPLLFAVQPHIELVGSTVGRLRFELAKDACGETTLDIQLVDDGVSACANSKLNVTRAQYPVVVQCVDDPPSFALGPCASCCAPTRSSPLVPSLSALPHPYGCRLGRCAITLCEDSSKHGYVLPHFIANSSAGPREGGEVGFVATTDNPAMFVSPPAISNEGQLTFTTARDGEAVVTVKAVDPGGLMSNAVSFVLTVHPSVPPPTFHPTQREVVVPHCPALYTPSTCRTALANVPCQHIIPAFVANTTSQTSLAVSVTPPSTLLAPLIDSRGTLSFSLPRGSTGARALMQITAATTATPRPTTCKVPAPATAEVEVVVVGGVDLCIACGPPVDAVVGRRLSVERFVTFHPTTLLAPSVAAVSNPSLFAAPPTLSPTGGLSLTTSSCGVSLVTVELFSKAHSASVNCTFPVTSHAPSLPTHGGDFEGSGDVVVNEDSGETCVQWIRGNSTTSAIGTGCGTTGGLVAYQVVADTPELFEVPPTIGPHGVLCFLPRRDMCGTSKVTVRRADTVEMFNLVVNCVNDVPTLTPSGDITVCVDGSSSVIAGWCRGLSPGPLLNEACPPSPQKLTFTTRTSHPHLFADPPAISPDTCTVAFTLHRLQRPTDITVYYTLCDDGPSEPPHTPCISEASFTIHAIPAEAEVSFSPSTNMLRVDEDAGNFTVPGWTQNVVAPPNLTASFTVEVLEGPELFVVPPRVIGADLSFVTSPNKHGTAELHACLRAEGVADCRGLAVQCCHRVVVTISSVNDPPSVTSASPVASDEDIPAAFDTWLVVSPGPPDERSQAIHVNVTYPPTAFTTLEVHPRPAALGEMALGLSYHPAPHVFGTFPVTLIFSDSGPPGPPPLPFVVNVTVRAVNDPPSFTPLFRTLTLPNASGGFEGEWGTAISPGPYETSQSVSFIVRTNDSSLFAAPPTVSPSGRLSLAPAGRGSALLTVVLVDSGGGPNSSSPPVDLAVTVLGSTPTPHPGAPHNITVLEDSGTTCIPWGGSGGTAFPPIVVGNGTACITTPPNLHGVFRVPTSSGDIVLTIVSVNDPPMLTPGPPVVVPEDAGLQRLQRWATGISAVEDGETIAANITCDTTMFTSPPHLSLQSGDLTFHTAPEANGEVLVEVVLRDSGGRAHGGWDTFHTTFVITIVAVNDPPAFHPTMVDIAVDEDCATQEVRAWAIDVVAGPQDEWRQALQFLVTPRRTDLFLAVPSVHPATGDLTFRPVDNANGEALLHVVLVDSGGTAHGGVNVSQAVGLRIVVRPVNDPPTFTPAASEIAVHGGAIVYPYVVGSSPGPADERHQGVAYHVDYPSEDFALPPRVAPDGNLTLQLADVVRSTVITITAVDTEGGRSTPHRLTVHRVDESPVVVHAVVWYTKVTGADMEVVDINRFKRDVSAALSTTVNVTGPYAMERCALVLVTFPSPASADAFLGTIADPTKPLRADLQVHEAYRPDGRGAPLACRAERKGDDGQGLGAELLAALAALIGVGVLLPTAVWVWRKWAARQGNGEDNDDEPTGKHPAPVAMEERVNPITVAFDPM